VVIAGMALKSRGDANRVQIDLLERSHRLEEEIIGISEREQQRLGRDLHDGLCQFLASIGFAAGSLASRLAHEAPRCAEPARQLAGLLEEAIIRTRGLARGLSPVDHDEGGLESALEELAESTSRLVGISCVVIAEGAEDSGVILENQRAVDVFRIAQEAVGNALKHSHARHVVIALDATGETLALRVSDDGIGFDENTTDRKGMGLNIMRYRARRAGGTLEISRNAPEGTVVSCTIQRTPAEPAETLATIV
jgi:signal transduction histidine kinase